MTTTQIETRTSIYTLRPDGIIVQRNLPDVAQTLDDARANVAAFTAMAAGQKRPLLVDARAIHSQAPGVREVYAGPDAMRFAAALALLVKTSGAGRVIANLFLTLSSPAAPTRVFADESVAIAWLLKITRAMSASATKP